LFHQGTLHLHSLNFGVITLLPKKAAAFMIQQYRRIFLLVDQNVIRSSQTALLPGRYILEGVVVLHETIHELHRKMKDGVILKLDFENVYNKIKWPFLQHVLCMKGFSPR
jgi:hypothetical protein